MIIDATTTNVDKSESTKSEPPKGERGVVLLWVAGMLVALLGVSAFAVDLGWLYLNTSRLQKAADAAALAGVVNLPASPVQADVDAMSAASANKYPIGNPVSNTFSSQVLADNQYEVTLRTQVGTFFLKVLGINSFNVERVATAQYVLPVPMGSPANCFGIGNLAALNSARFPVGLSPDTARGLCDDYTQNFWAAINGQQTAKEQGDPYMSRCFFSALGSCSGTPNPNDEWNTVNHYHYGITVPNSAPSLDVWIYDAGFYARTDFNTDTGDTQWNGGGSTTGGANTVFTLKRPDLTPYDPTDNVTACTMTVNSGASVATYRNMWAKICTPSGPFGGTWVLKVTTTGAIGGTNQYSILVNTGNIAAGSLMPRVYGINDMSIFTNQPTGVATVWLAEILPVHAGKKLQLNFFDGGESAAPATMTVKNPAGAMASNCVWTATNGATGSTCSIATAVGCCAIFNNHWITITIDIPSNYTCDPTANNNSGCYWKMDLSTQSAHDRTTWSARVIGNPVRLVPNG
jgi:hypothetical protein